MKPQWNSDKPSDGTSASLLATADEDYGTYASPPCFMHELGPAYLGYMGRDELLEFLGGMLGEIKRSEPLIADARAGARTADAMTLLDGIRADMARFSAMLIGYVQCINGASGRSGVIPADGTGETSTGQTESITSFSDSQTKLLFRLARGLPRIHEDRLRADLAAMLIRLWRNLECCAETCCVADDSRGRNCC
jgi:hypothetical protein